MVVIKVMKKIFVTFQENLYKAVDNLEWAVFYFFQSSDGCNLKRHMHEKMSCAKFE